MWLAMKPRTGAGTPVSPTGSSLGRLHHEHRARRSMGDGVRHAAEHASVHALVADHEHVGAARLGQADEHLAGVALVGQGPALDAIAPEVLLGARKDLVEPRRRAGCPLPLGVARAVRALLVLIDAQ